MNEKKRNELVSGKSKCIIYIIFFTKTIKKENRIK